MNDQYDNSKLDKEMLERWQRGRLAPHERRALGGVGKQLDKALRKRRY